MQEKFLELIFVSLHEVAVDYSKQLHAEEREINRSHRPNFLILIDLGSSQKQQYRVRHGSCKPISIGTAH